MKKERVGIFGGTFDPPHVGHLILAMEAMDQLSLDKVMWVLAPNPPHKQGKRITPVDIRIELVNIAIGDDRNFELSYADINRPGPHYILDTMYILREEFPDADLAFLMGGDSLHDLLEWHKPREFIDACDHVGVMRRPGEVINIDHLIKEIPALEAKMEFIDAPLLEISSNQIRQLIRNGQPYRYYLPVGVYHLIEESGLYVQGEQDEELEK